jgi:hypothetical protein
MAACKIFACIIEKRGRRPEDDTGHSNAARWPRRIALSGWFRLTSFHDQV